MNLSKRMLESIINYNKSAPIKQQPHQKQPNFPTRATNTSRSSILPNTPQSAKFSPVTPTQPHFSQLFIPDKKLFYSVIYTPQQIAQAALGIGDRKSENVSPRPPCSPRMPIASSRLRLQIEDLETEFQLFAKKKTFPRLKNPSFDYD